MFGLSSGFYVPMRCQYFRSGKPYNTPAIAPCQVEPQDNPAASLNFPAKTH
jgi:hypothetical protein